MNKASIKKVCEERDCSIPEAKHIIREAEERKRKRKKRDFQSVDCKVKVPVVGEVDSKNGKVKFYSEKYK